MPAIPNPYETLRIDVLCSTAEIVARSQELIETAAGEDEKLVLRSAAEALATHPGDRAYHKLWEPSDSAYGNAAEAEYRRCHGKNPFAPQELRRRAVAFVNEDCSPLRLLPGLTPDLSPPPELTAISLEDSGPTEAKDVESWELFL